MKRKIIIILILLILLLISVNILYAQTYVQSRLEVDGITPFIATQLVFSGSSVPSRIDDFEFEEETDLKLGRAEIRSTSTNTRIINNRRSINVTLHVFIPILSENEGEMTVPSVRIKAGGKTFLTTPMKVEFFKVGNNKYSAKLINDDNNEDVIRFKLTVETESAYPQQPVTIRSDIYLSGIQNYQPNTVEMVFTFLEDIGEQNIEPIQPKQGTGDRVSLSVRNIDKNFIFRQNGTEKLGNKIYVRYSGWFNIYPTESGELILYASKLNVIYSESRNSFFSSFDDTVEFFAYSEPITLNIKDFPNINKPEHFSGAVGRYSIRAEVDKTTIRVGEPLILKLIISGEGILENIERPNLEQIKEFAERFKVSREKTPGEIVANTIQFDYTIRPISDNVEYVPSIPFSYFNVDSDNYETATTRQIPLYVTSGKIVGDEDIISNIDEDETSLDNQNRLTTTEGILSNYNQPDALNDRRINISYLFLLLIIPIAYIITYIIIKRQKAFEEDISAKRFKIAKRKFNQYISKAENNIGNDNFYQHLSEGLMGYISDKFNLGQGEITPADLDDIFKIHNINRYRVNGMVDELKNILRKCEMGRFASSGLFNKEDRQELLTKTKKIINDLESIQKKR